MSRIRRQERVDISQQEAEERLQPYCETLERDVVRGAWADWESLPPETRAKLDARARASILHSFMVHRVEELFPPDGATARSLHINGLFLLGVADRVTLRFKKLRSSRKTSNIPTNQQVEFGLQLDLPGFPRAARLNIGYILDPTQTRITEVLVTFQVGRVVIWDFPLRGGGTLVQIPLPSGRRPQAPRVTARRSRRQSSSNE